MKSGNLTGPHSRKEAELLIAGKKPASIISLPEDLAKLIPYIRHGKLVAKKLKYDNYPNIWSVVVAQPKEKWRIDKIIHLVYNPLTKLYFQLCRIFYRLLANP